MRKLTISNVEKNDDLSIIQHGCTCTAYCSIIDPEEYFNYYYYLHIDDNNSVVGGGVS